ncbi:hypothetical protein J437_LFUL002863 [Ladona fulva]|uniref:Haloacid dehalogenase-like hydrolase domain-containing protein 3 n=1 Tax=Ladona fulva TaxID=123851 RepID=A0A8K0K386_LADFU|nr:hypothetical protein J437_LFUL002863 [Ladona fulva]
MKFTLRSGSKTGYCTETVTMASTLPSAASKSLQLVTFDITGTLLQFRRSIAEQYAVIGAKFGVHAEHSDISTGFKQQWRRQCTEHPNFGAKTGLPWKSWWVDVAKSTFLHAPSLRFEDEEVMKDMKKREAKLETLAQHLIDVYSTSECWHVTEGAEEVLEKLQKEGLVLGVVSNFDSRLDGLLSVMGLKEFFSFIVTSYEVGVEKPDVMIFEEALKRAAKVLGNGHPVDPKHACHVGDTPSSDYVGAVLAGWNAAIIHSCPDKIGKSCKDVDPRHVISSLKELEVYLLSGRQNRATSSNS